MRRFDFRYFAASVAVVGFLSSPALAQSGKGQDDRTFNQNDQKIITEGLKDSKSGGQKAQPNSGQKAKQPANGQKTKGNTPKASQKPAGQGQTKHVSQTPGHQKQLARGGAIPPGLKKRSLPPKLTARLAPPPHGTERYIVGNDVVLVEKATGIILDILHNVVK